MVTVESLPESALDESFGGYPGEDRSVDTESRSRELRLIIRLGRPFDTLLLATAWCIGIGSQDHSMGQGHDFR